jgi:hypothetical protein
MGILPLLLMQGLSLPNLNSAAMMPMSRLAGTAAAVIGAISTLGGAVLGAIIDGFYDGSVTPFALAALLAVASAFVLWRWSDATWEREAERQLLTPEALAQAQAAAPLEVG